jgi:hypothetical protein
VIEWGVIMTEPIDIQFGQSENDPLIIRVLGGAYPDDPYSRDWLTLQVDIELDGFSAHVENTVQITEIYQFYVQLESLYQSLQGTASFETLEHWLQLTVSAGKLGQIYISGSISHPVGGVRESATLHFELDETDQTYLSETLKQLKNVVAQYHSQK